MSSRLFQEVREKRGLVYSIGSSLNAYRLGGYETISAACARKNLPRVLEVTLRELRKLKRGGSPPAELAWAKENLKGEPDPGARVDGLPDVRRGAPGVLLRPGLSGRESGSRGSRPSSADEVGAKPSASSTAACSRLSVVGNVGELPVDGRRPRGGAVGGRVPRGSEPTASIDALRVASGRGIRARPRRAGPSGEALEHPDPPARRDVPVRARCPASHPRGRGHPVFRDRKFRSSRTVREIGGRGVSAALRGVGAFLDFAGRLRSHDALPRPRCSTRPGSPRSRSMRTPCGSAETFGVRGVVSSRGSEERCPSRARSIWSSPSLSSATCPRDASSPGSAGSAGSSRRGGLLVFSSTAMQLLPGAGRGSPPSGIVFRAASETERLDGAQEYGTSCVTPEFVRRAAEPPRLPRTDSRFRADGLCGEQDLYVLAARRRPAGQILPSRATPWGPASLGGKSEGGAVTARGWAEGDAGRAASGRAALHRHRSSRKSRRGGGPGAPPRVGLRVSDGGIAPDESCGSRPRASAAHRDCSSRRRSGPYLPASLRTNP